MADIVRYQVMPPLSAEEYQELYEDIKANGVLVPIVVDEDEVIIDGHHRAKIAAELGIPCPEELVSAKSEQEKRSIAFTLNLKRRHLNREQRRALIAESLKADPHLSNREHARRTGASHPTVNDVRNEMEEDGRLEKFTSRTSADGRERPASQPRRGPVEPEPAVPEQQEPTEAPIGNIITQDDLAELNQPVEKPAPHNTEPRAEAITSQFTSAIADLNRVLNKLDRITRDKNFPRNKEKVAAMHRNDLIRAIDELQTLVDNTN